MKLRILCLFLSAVLCVDAVAAAGAAPNADSKVPPASADFILRAYQFNTTQITLGKLAEQHVQKGSTFSLAVKLIISHTNIALRLTELAAKAGVTFPAKPDQEHQALIEHLQSVSDRDFDREYIGAVITAQQQAIVLFEDEALQQSSDAQNIAATVLPLLREHLKLAQEAQTNLPKQEGIKLTPNLEKR